MIYGSTKTRLDYIMANGLRRIDAAVEKVIAKYDDNHWCSGEQWADKQWPDSPKHEFNLLNPCNAGTLHVYEKGATEDKITYADAFMGMSGQPDVLRAQREYNQGLAAMANAMGLAQQKYPNEFNRGQLLAQQSSFASNLAQQQAGFGGMNAQFSAQAEWVRRRGIGI